MKTPSQYLMKEESSFEEDIFDKLIYNKYPVFFLNRISGMVTIVPLTDM